MKTQEIAIGSQTTINVKMQADVIGLEEVVAIGYGTEKRVNVIGSVSQISAERIRQIENGALKKLKAAMSNAA